MFKVFDRIYSDIKECKDRWKMLNILFVYMYCFSFLKFAIPTNGPVYTKPVYIFLLVVF